MALVDAGVSKGDVHLIEAPRIGHHAAGEPCRFEHRRTAGREIAEARLGKLEERILVDLAGSSQD